MGHRETFPNRGPLYTVSFSDQECSGVALRDLFEILGATDTRYRLHQLELSQHSEVAGASDEKYLIEIYSATAAATPSSGGTAGAPTRYLDKGATALCTANYNATQVGGTSTDETLRWSGVWHANESFNYEPATDKRIQVGLSGRLTVRMPTVPADALSLNGTIVWEEIGKVPGES